MVAGGMAGTRKAREGRLRISQGFKVESLLFVAFFATLPVYSPNMVMFHDAFPDAAEAFMAPFVNALLGTAAVVGVACAFFAARRGDDAFFGLPAVGAGAVCYLAGFVLFGLVLVVEGFGSAVVSAAAGLLAAVGTVVLCIAWGTCLAQYDLRQALANLALMIGMASVVELLLAAVSAPVGMAVFAFLLVLGVALPVWKAARGELSCLCDAAASDGEMQAFKAAVRGGARAVDDAAADDGSLARRLRAPWSGGVRAAVFAPGDAGEGAPAPARAFFSTVRRMASVLAVPFLGLMVFGYIMGVRKFLVFDVFYMEVLGGIAAAVLMVPLCLLKTTRPLLSVIYQAALPCFALMLVVLNSFPVGGGPQWLAATASYVFYGAIAILALASLCAMAHAGEFSPASIYGLAVAAFSVVSLAGIFSGSLPAFADYGGGPILLVVSTCYFAILIGATLVGAWRREGAELEGRTGSGAKDAADGLQERCERVADDGGLSPREREILGYLGRGHGIVFVANTLVISESTVRTHVKSIYRKLGVSSREDLLQLIDG